MSKSVSVGKTPRIKADVIDGDLSVAGWDGENLLISADDDELRLEQNGDEIVLSCRDDLSLRVPKNASLYLTTINGDASFRGVMGDIELKNVSGDLSIRNCGSISIDSVESDFSLKNTKGNLYVKRANGDVSIHDVEGNISLESIADDLALRGARGNINVNVGEDVVVYLEPRGDGDYSITAGDDILLVLPSNADAALDIQGDEIFIDLPGIQNEAVTQRTVTLGNGAAKISLNAGGDVRVSNRADAGESADEFGNFAGMNFDWSGLGERISRQVEQATARASRRVQEAARRAERHAERHARHGRWNWDFKNIPNPPSSSVPPSEPVSDAERMAILQMLAEKKITSQQAEELLNALEGGK